MAQRGEVLGDVLHLGAGLGLQAHREAEEARVVQQTSERFGPEMALADMLMAIDARMKGLERIVETTRDQALDSDVLVQLRKRALVAFAAAQIIPRGEGMLGVEAQPPPLVFFDRIEDPPHLLERVAEIATLPGGDFKREP